MILDDGFLIDGKPVPAPDAGAELSCQDLDSEDAGRDEAGFLHRAVLREKVHTWGLQYAFLTAAEYQYLTGLFAGKPTFTVTYRDLDGQTVNTLAYCAQFSAALKNRSTGICQNVKLNIIEC